MTIHLFNKQKPIYAYIQATWTLIHVREGMWDEMEGFGMGRQTRNKTFLLCA